MSLKRSHSLDLIDPGEGSSQAFDDRFSRALKKGKRDKGEKESLTQPELISREQASAIPTEKNNTPLNIELGT